MAEVLPLDALPALLLGILLGVLVAAWVGAWRARRQAPAPHSAPGTTATTPRPIQPATSPVGSDSLSGASRTIYEEVIDAVREIVFRTDSEGRFIFLNRAWETTTAYPVAASLGKRLVEFLHPDDRAAARESLQQLLGGDAPEYHGQYRLLMRKGEICWIEVTARLVSRGDTAPNARSLVGTIDDISIRKVAEMSLRNINQELEARVRVRTAELEASNRELEAFSYSVSHDLRAPLRSINGFARILEDELAPHLDASTRSHLERIRRAARQMGYLIDKLIELARFTRHNLRKENVNLSEIAIQIIDDLRAEDPDRMVDVEITSDLMATADRTLMRVVLQNLLRNAWKFTARREQARITFHGSIEESRRVFCISDNGVGFDMAFVGNLFRPFNRLHDESEFAGSGIGLANVQRIIERHGGRIWAQSTPGKGASFFFTLDR